MVADAEVAALVDVGEAEARICAGLGVLVCWVLGLGVYEVYRA